jgi:hypothetical protein
MTRRLDGFRYRSEGRNERRDSSWGQRNEVESDNLANQQTTFADL